MMAPYGFWHSALVLLLLIGILVLDRLTPLGFADGYLYLLPLALSFRLRDNRIPYAIAAISTLLIVAGYFLSPPGTHDFLAIMNRTLSIVAIWAAIVVQQAHAAAPALPTAAAVPAPLPEDEADRLSVLRTYDVLDTESESELDDMTQLAAALCETPIALISLVDSDRQWFKSKVGLDAEQTSRHVAFCAHTILGNEPLVVPDALADERFRHNPLVTGEPHIRFYYGMPLVTPEGFRIGTLSVIDHVPRTLTASQEETMRVLSRQVIEHLMLNRSLKELTITHSRLREAYETLRQSEDKLRVLSASSPAAIFIYRGNRILYANESAALISGYSVDELLTMDMWQMGHPDFLSLLKARAQAVMQGDFGPGRLEFKIIRKDGQVRWLDFVAGTIDYGGRPARLATGYDITEKKHAEAVKDTQGKVLESIATGQSLSETLTLLILEIEKLNPNMLGSVLLLDPTGRRLHLGAAPHLPAEYSQAIEGGEIGPAAGSCGTSCYRKERVVVTDIASDPLWKEYKHLALPHGLRACWSEPIVSESGRVLGSFAMYFSDSQAPSEENLALIRTAAHLAGIAIERKQTEQALIERERMLQLIFDSEPECVKVLDAEGRVLNMNRSGLDMLEAGSLQQIAHQCVYPLVTETDRARFQALTERVFRGESGTIEFEMVGLKGTHRVLETHASPLRDHEGKVVALLGITRDITERKQAEEALRASERLNQSVLDSLSAHIAVLDGTGTIVAVNSQWSRFADENGRPSLSAVGIGVNYLEACRDASRDENADGGVREAFDGIRAVLERRWDSFACEYPCHSPTEERWFLMSVTPLADRDGAVVAHVNVTDRKQSELNLAAANERLRELAFSIQSAVDEEQRRIARELHDEFGQVLTALKFDLTKVAGQLQSGPKATAAANVLTQIQSLSGLVDSLIQSSRKLAYSLRPSMLDDLGLADALQAHVDQFHTRTGIRCNVALSPRLTSLDLDDTMASALFRIAQELLTNVARHSEATQVDLKLEDDSGRVILTVSDNGLGITRADQAKRTSFGLLGIRERVSLLEGTCTIDGRAGEGTTITVQLPLRIRARGVSEDAETFDRR